MAELGVSGIDEVIKRLETAGLFDEQTQKEMLFEGAEIMKKAAQNTMRKHVDTGETVRRIGYVKTVKTTKHGARRVTVTVKGKDKMGERYAVKAFVLNYGRSAKHGQIPASYAWTGARKSAEPQIAKAWERIVTNKLKTKGLI